MSSISTRDLEKFSRKLGKMLSSGIPLLTALELTGRDHFNAEFAAVIEKVLGRMRDGYTFSSSLAMFSGIFTEVYVALVQAGENQGRLDGALLEIADGCAEGTIEAGRGGFEADEDAAAHDDQSLLVVEYLNRIIADAVKNKFSQIIFKPERDHARLLIRAGRRLDCRESVDRNFYERLIARVKIISALDISERHLPQDGRVLMQVDSELVDIRVQLLPSIMGEQIMLFFDGLRREKKSLPGIFPDPLQLQLFKSILADLPAGVIIFAGPAGCGKTTTLEAALDELNDGSRMIVAVSSIHRNIPGVTCMQMRPHIGLDLLRSIQGAIRAEADVIVVDDLCDHECAVELFKAANQGTLVLTQMSARNSSEVFRQLLNLGIPPYLVYGGIGAVFFQVLARRLCQQCAKKTAFGQEDLFRLGLTDIPAGEYTESSGCKTCNNSGYRGFFPFYEISRPGKNLKEALIKAEMTGITMAVEEMHGTALESLIRDYVKNGNTSPQEASRIRSIMFFDKK